MVVGALLGWLVCRSGLLLFSPIFQRMPCGGWLSNSHLHPSSRFARGNLEKGNFKSTYGRTAGDCLIFLFFFLFASNFSQLQRDRYFKIGKGFGKWATKTEKNRRLPIQHCRGILQQHRCFFFIHQNKNIVVVSIASGNLGMSRLKSANFGNYSLFCRSVGLETSPGQRKANIQGRN